MRDGNLQLAKSVSHGLARRDRSDGKTVEKVFEVFQAHSATYRSRLSNAIFEGHDDRERLHYSYAEYQELLARSDFKLEYCDGVIYAMAGGTIAHAELAAAAIRPARQGARRLSRLHERLEQPALKAADERKLKKLRAICMALPDANEKISHGEPTWFAGKGKVFAMFDNHHHDSEHIAVWLPLPTGMQEMLIELDSSRYFRPPYVGHKGWVGMVLDGKPDWDKVADLVREAFLHVAGKRLHRVRNERIRGSPQPELRDCGH